MKAQSAIHIMSWAEQTSAKLHDQMNLVIDKGNLKDPEVKSLLSTIIDAIQKVDALYVEASMTPAPEPRGF